MKSNVLLESHLKTLRLPTFLKEYQRAARQCGEQDKHYDEFLLYLAELEVAEREKNATARRISQAGFPAVKDLSDFDFSAVPKLNKKRILDLARCEYVNRRENLVFVGPPKLPT